MLTPKMFNVVPWKMSMKGACILCHADCSHDPTWGAGLEVAPVTAIDYVEWDNVLHVIVRVDLNSQEALELDFWPAAYPFLARLLQGDRLRLWVNDDGGIEVVGMAKYLQIVRDFFRASAGLAVTQRPADDLLRHLELPEIDVDDWEVEDCA